MHASGGLFYDTLHMIHSSPILLLALRMTDDSKAIWKAALNLGWSIQRIGTIF